MTPPKLTAAVRGIIELLLRCGSFLPAALLLASVDVSAEPVTLKSLGVVFDKPEFWSVKTEPLAVSIIHRGGDANCVVSLKFIAGVEVLSREELERKLTDDMRKAPVAEMLALRYRSAKVLEQGETIVSGIKGIGHLVQIDRRPAQSDSERSLESVLKGLEQNRNALGGAVTLPPSSPQASRVEIVPLSRSRIVTALNNVGAYTIVCTAPDADFDVADRIFMPFIRSIQLLGRLEQK